MGFGQADMSKVNRVQAGTVFFIISLIVIIGVLIGVLFARGRREPSETNGETTEADDFLTNFTLMTRMTQIPPLPQSPFSELVDVVTPAAAAVTRRPTTAKLKPPKKPDLHLPGNLEPRHYDIRVQPFLEDGNFTFHGEVTITMTVLNKLRTISLHSYKLTLVSVKVYLDEGYKLREIPVSDVTLDLVRQFVLILLSEDVFPRSNVVLSITYSGTLTTDLRGFHIVSYRDPRGNNRVIATSQFQPVDARKAFPCFDEPSYKATFNVTLVRPPNMVTLSNMDILRKEPTWDGAMADVYETTPPMSTYLLAFIVCDFPMRSTTSKNGIEIRAISRPGTARLTKYALKAASQTITFFTEFFHTDFPLKKLDMIAMPQFLAGGMENWGLAVFHESKLLCNESSSDVFTRYRVRLTVAHEVAHQWFGDLVTPSWWDDLWLNEGFASYVAQLGAHDFEAVGTVDGLIVAREMAPAMVSDSLISSHPVSATVHDPKEIGHIFDAISYYKGASLIRMMRAMLGDAVFRNGLKTFLQNHAYSTATTADLWTALGATARKYGADIDVKDIMKKWTDQIGYPVVTLSRVPSGGQIHISQERYLMLRNATIDLNQKKFVWKVPITITTKSERDFDEPRLIWLTEKDAYFDTDYIKDDDWIIANIKMRAFFRVNYDRQNWEDLIRQLYFNHELVDAVNRGQLIDDAFWLARSGHVEQAIPFKIIRYLVKETEYLPWKLAFDNFYELYGLLSLSRSFGNFKTYVVKLLSPMYDELGWKEAIVDDAMKISLRSMVLRAACQFGHPHCRQHAIQHRLWLSKHETGKGFVYCTAIAEGGVSEWESAWQMYTDSKNGNERRELLEALACTVQPWLIQRYLNDTLNSPMVKPREAVFAISALASQPIGRSYAWAFARYHWEALIEKFAGNFFLKRMLIFQITRYLCQEEELKELENFVSQLPDAEANDLPWRQAVEKARANARWLHQSDTIIVKWFEDNVENL